MTIPGIKSLALVLIAGLVCGMASATTPASDAVVAEWQLPEWASNVDGARGEVRVESKDPVQQIMVHYAYPDGTEGSVAAKPVGGNADKYTFRVPGVFDAGTGSLNLHAEVVTASGTVNTDIQQVPLAYEEDLDITGNPPVELRFPLGGDDALVKYIPCCNIFGASTIAKRVPANPMGTTEGLPAKLFSDFIVLEPDQLSASTAGLYFQFTYMPDRLADVDESNLSVYEYDWAVDRWAPLLDFEQDASANTITIHCTHGGAFVLGEKS